MEKEAMQGAALSRRGFIGMGIAAVGEVDSSDAAGVIDATGKLVSPSFCDTHISRALDMAVANGTGLIKTNNTWGPEGRQGRRQGRRAGVGAVCPESSRDDLDICQSPAATPGMPITTRASHAGFANVTP